MCLRLKLLPIWGVGGLPVYGICSRRLVNSEVVEAGSDYQKSYLQRFRNTACGDSIGNNHIQKDRVIVPPGIVLGKGKEGLCGLVRVKCL